MVDKMDRNGLFLMTMVCFSATANSATQGYDGSMMNGLQILPAYATYFRLSPALLSLNVAIVALGSVVAMPFAAVICDRYGRKWGIASTAFVAILGATIQGAAVHEAMFCVGRFVVGFSITLGSVAGPIYVAEVAHPSYRARLTSLYGAFWYVGAILASIITFGTQYIDSTWCWRLPSLLQFIPSILCLLPLPFIPESPRWLMYKDRHTEALAMLTKYHGNGDPNSELVSLEYEEIRQTLEFEKSVQKTEFKALVATKPNRRRLAIVVAVGVFCQLSGNNTVTYYLGDVLDSAGITSTNTQLAINIGLSISNLLIAILGSLFIDALPRRLSFLLSTSFMALTLVLMSILTALYSGTTNASASAATVFLIFLFYAFYSIAWSPLSYLYPVEVLNYSLRANGNAVLTGTLYIATFFNTYTIPYAMAWSGWGFYLISAGWCVVEIGLMWAWFPETRGMTLEEIDVVFDRVRHFEGAGMNEGYPGEIESEVVRVKEQGRSGKGGGV